MLKLLSRWFFATSLAVAAVILPGCGDSSAPAMSLPADKSSASLLATLETQGAGFKAGVDSAKPAVYVIFDPQCPHCGAFWEDSKAVRKTRQFIWVPIALLRAPANRPQGAAILDAADPVALMDEHEKSIQARHGGISAGHASDAALAKMDRNTAIAKHFGIEGVPMLLMAQGEKVFTLTGAPRPDQMQAMFR